MLYPHSSHTDLTIKNPTERYTWAAWLIFVVLTSLIGDTIILLATTYHHAIRLHSVVVTFIQHIAVSDILVSLTLLLPNSTSLLNNTWIYGPVLCSARPYFSYPGYQAGRLLVCVMTTCKLLILKFPLRSITWTAAHAHLACAGIWVISLSWPVSFLAVDKGDVKFDYRYYTCTYQFADNVTWDVIKPTITALLYILPNLLIVITSVLILVIARRVARESRRGLKWQGVTTVLLSATVYSISFLPNTVINIVVIFVKEQSGVFTVTFSRVAAGVLTINIVSNFFIYCLTVSSFREFLLERVRRSRDWVMSRGCVTLAVSLSRACRRDCGDANYAGNGGTIGTQRESVV